MYLEFEIKKKKSFTAESDFEYTSSYIKGWK